MNRLPANLAHLLAQAGTSENALSEMTGVPQPTINRILNKKSKSPRDATLYPIASYFGISVEQLLRDDLTAASPQAIRTPETTPGQYHVDQLDARGDMGDGAVNEDYPEVIRSVDFAEPYIRAVLGFLPAPGRLKLVTGVGNSMVPDINPGEAVLIDTGCTEYRGDGIYLINSGNGHQLKALQDRGDAIYVVSANNLYPPFPAKKETIIGGRAYLLNRIQRLS